MMWKKRWGYEMATKPTRPGVYRLKTGGFFVRARVTNKLSRRVEVSAVLHDAKTVASAQASLDELVAAARAAATGVIRKPPRWSAFAVSLLEERVRRGRIESEATVDGWRDLIKLVDPVWGHIDAPRVLRQHIEDWLNTTVAKWMVEGRTVLKKRRVGGRKGTLEMVPVTSDIKPVTVNNWLRIIRAISHEIRDRFDLPRSAFKGIDFFVEDRPYTKEEPNALRTEDETIGQFLRLAREKYPQHYAMIYLGFVTGLRPSSLRPLRRKGSESDINWETGELQVRRSHSRRQHIMNRTKSKVDNVFTLPIEVLGVLRDHAGSLEGAMAKSDLLFPSETGELRTRGVLTKPFAAIRAELGITYRITPRAMRRTFNDMARAAGIHDVVTRAISGHQDQEMQLHYSTAQSQETRTALAKVAATAAGKPAKETP